MVDEPRMDFVWPCCFGRIDITNGCFDLVCCEGLTYLLILHLTDQPNIKHLLNSFLMLLKFEITHIPGKFYEAVDFLLLSDKVFFIFGYGSSGWHTSICSKAAQD